MPPMTGWTQAALGLGGNVGDPPSAMARALAMLDARADCAITAVSRLHRTPPWGKTDQAWFVNACALLETRLEPLVLLEACLEIERALKRVRGERWGPRTIDIDVLTYGDAALAMSGLTLPHPRMTERGFVLVPLAEIAPDLVVDGRTVAEWAEHAERAGIEPASDDAQWWKGASDG
ncbi:2-amino-4-hydroxy-6-hydroxymethyldihydropteridine diphosphokinase [Pararhizobium mangrovi]|uniref:2-amino-4-hydroxy-6-hydroxymethyldihydropteridine pyrophosphokinase n=1 Tax=Pararhizobium mangrovi TaxID=2590452 RepID=A0A506UFR5_9HYPH|nr:2-amino-4-hydroxy-6-hydroxymethyldihydropteridine diphosphokinase [Pararhizobium mangrovi]TPW31954.1 2-amino-4-hydroxy-6-hydroxymethyldihydropteridine diphosphokinase [Pararhizobium mangrovi]